MINFVSSGKIFVQRSNGRVRNEWGKGDIRMIKSFSLEHKKGSLVRFTGVTEQLSDFSSYTYKLD